MADRLTMPCARPDDAFLDTEDWAFTLALTDPETGQPRDVTGSAFRLTFTTALGEEIVTASTADETITIVDAPAGKLSVSLLATARTWRLPRRVGSLAYAQPVTIFGDLMRRPSVGQPYLTESQAALRFLVRPGTTEWPAPSP